MRPRLAASPQRTPVLARPRKRRVRARRPAGTSRPGRPFAAPPARVPSVVKMSMMLVPRRTMAEARVPFLRMSGRWLAELGFAIGAPVYVQVEPGRVILTNTKPGDTSDETAAESSAGA